MKHVLRLTLMMAMLFVASCKEEVVSPDTGLAGFHPDLVEKQRESCLERGGRYGRGGLSGTFVCYEQTRDANQSCSTASDCEGYCLARSRTCTPIVPLYGCHEVLTVSGTRSTICVE